MWYDDRVQVVRENVQVHCIIDKGRSGRQRGQDPREMGHESLIEALLVLNLAAVRKW